MAKDKRLTHGITPGSGRTVYCGDPGPGRRASHLPDRVDCPPCLEVMSA